MTVNTFKISRVCSCHKLNLLTLDKSDLCPPSFQIYHVPPQVWFVLDISLYPLQFWFTSLKSLHLPYTSPSKSHLHFVCLPVSHIPPLPSLIYIMQVCLSLLYQVWFTSGKSVSHVPHSLSDLHLADLSVSHVLSFPGLIYILSFCKSDSHVPPLPSLIYILQIFCLPSTSLSKSDYVV